MKSSSYESNEDFYEECAQIVEQFCRDRGIKYHIKYGTKKRDNHTTSKIFNPVPLVSFQTSCFSQDLLVA